MNVYVLAFSGGLDSTTTLYKILNEKESDDIVICANFSYGQVNYVERFCAEGIFHKLKKIHGEKLQLVRSSVDLGFTQFETSESQSKLQFYFPFRNLILASSLASIGEAYCITKNIKPDAVKIVLGIHKHTSYEEYWDIKKEFACAFQNIMYQNKNFDFEVYMPFVKATKGEICKEAKKLGVPFKKTWTCYDPVYTDEYIQACMECEACNERKKYCGYAYTFTIVNKQDFLDFLAYEKEQENDSSE